jgi:hypothetical protein
MAFPVASRDYLQLAISILPDLSYQEGFPIWHSQSLRNFWYLVGFSPDVSELLASILGVIGLFLFFRFRRRFKDEKFLLFAAAIALTLWIAPHALVYEWALLLLPAVILWQGGYVLYEKLRPVYALMWVAAFISGPLTQLQLNLFSWAVQISTIVFAFVLAVLFIPLLHSDRNFLPEDR